MIHRGTARLGRDFAVGFFDDPPTKEALSRLSNSQRVVIFAGAGVAADQNYPSWSGLVASLLSTALNSMMSADSREEVDKIALAITSQYYQIPTATIIDHIYEDLWKGRGREERDKELRQALYAASGQDDFLNPSTLVARILLTALTLKATGVEVHIVTTNYDDLFEHTANDSIALESFDDWGIEVKSFSEAPPGATDDLTSVIPVVHVHGFLPRHQKSAGINLVFSESDYIAWDDKSSFREYLIRMFGGSDVLMIGTSLRDLNIAAKLQLSANTAYRRYALLPAQSELQQFAGVSRQFAEQVAQFATYRGRELHVEVLRPDFYGQVHQFLDELGFAKSRGGESHQGDYSSRIRGWADTWSPSRYGDISVLTDVTNELVKLSESTQKLCGMRVQAVKSEIWVRTQPNVRKLELWCDSRSIRLIGQAGYQRHQVDIDAYSDHVAVKCFAAHSPIYGRSDPLTSRRWTHFVALPILTASKMQVGVIVVRLSAPKDLGASCPPTLKSKWQEVTQRMLRTAESALGVSLADY